VSALAKEFSATTGTAASATNRTTWPTCLVAHDLLTDDLQT
jgi:hypothetical protein